MTDLNKHQGLGRLFRVGQVPVVITPPPSIEAEVVAKIQQKLVILNKSVLQKNDQSLNLYPFQKVNVKRLIKQMKKDKGLTLS